MSDEIDMDKHKREEEITAALVQACAILARAAKIPAVAMTICVSFRESNDKAVLHTATVAMGDEVARAHTLMAAEALVSDSKSKKEEVPS